MKFKFLQYGRSERPENEDNAKGFLSDVYKNGTRTKKLQAEASLYGRSMVEMLGVLAIIGVLSVGGIAGYSKAMYKYRMNQTIQTVTQALQNVIEFSYKNWGEGSWIELDTSQYIKYGLLPESICPADYVNTQGETGVSCRLPLGEMDIAIANGAQFNKKLAGQFWIRFYEGNIVESCVDFLSYHWEKLYPKEWLVPDDGGDGTRIDIYFGNKGGTTLWAYQKEVAKTDINLSDIQEACDKCRGGSYCEIGMIFNREI